MLTLKHSLRNSHNFTSCFFMSPAFYWLFQMIAILDIHPIPHIYAQLLAKGNVLNLIFNYKTYIQGIVIQLCISALINIIISYIFLMSRGNLKLFYMLVQTRYYSPLCIILQFEQENELLLLQEYLLFKLLFPTIDYNCQFK